MPAEPTRQQTEKRRHPEPSDTAQASEPTPGQLDSEQIARRAYERFEARGREHGHDQEDWFDAEEELRGTRGE
jgi:hypothetical protein